MAKILASIAIEKIPVSACSYTFRHEVMEVEVVKYLRQRCGSYGAARTRYYYSALIKRPVRMAAEYDFARQSDGLLCVNVVRSLNKGWKLPVFPDGLNVVDVPATPAPTGEKGMK